MIGLHHGFFHKPLFPALGPFSLIESIVGITSPSGKAQEQLMRDVYRRANISPKDVGFVEAHG